MDDNMAAMKIAKKLVEFFIVIVCKYFCRFYGQDERTEQASER